MTKKTIKEKTLEAFLKQHNVCGDGFEFAKDLTLEQFLKTCKRGDWILWLFFRTNPNSFTELTLAKALCANTVRHLMKDERSINAIDIAIKFGQGLATQDELADAAADANEAANDADEAANAAYAADAASYDADAASYDVDYEAALAALAASDELANAAYAAAKAADAAFYAATDGDFYAARKKNQKATADICREYLPFKIWNF